MSVRGTLGTVARRVTPVGGSVIRVDTSESVVALTFDDGPDPERTPALLDVLAAHDAHATFFLLGERALRHPELVARIVAEGHDLGSHGWRHESAINGTLQPGLRHELRHVRDGARALRPFTPGFYRAPFGFQSRWTRLAAATARMTVVGWSDSPRDWEDVDGDALSARLQLMLRPGGIVLLHDGLDAPDGSVPAEPMQTVAAVATLLEDSPEWEYINLTSLLGRGRPVRLLRRPDIRIPDSDR